MNDAYLYQLFIRTFFFSNASIFISSQPDIIEDSKLRYFFWNNHSTKSLH